MLMENPEKSNPGSGPRPDKSCRGKSIPFFAWPLLICAAGFDIWVGLFLGSPLKPILSPWVILFLVTWFGISKWKQTH